MKLNLITTKEKLSSPKYFLSEFLSFVPTPEWCTMPVVRSAPTPLTHSGQHHRQKAAVGHLQTARLQAEQVIWLGGNDPANPWNVQQGTRCRMMQEKVASSRLDCIRPSAETAGFRWMCLCRVNGVKISYSDKAGGLNNVGRQISSEMFRS